MIRTISATLMLIASSVSVRAEEYVVRIDSLDLVRELGDGAERPVGNEQININDEPETIAESIEVKVKTGERFYGKAIRGRKVFEIRGRLKPSDDRDHIALEIQASEYIRTGELVQGPDGVEKELSVGQRIQSTVLLIVGQPLRLGQMHSVSSGAGVPDRFSCHDFWARVDVVVQSER